MPHDLERRLEDRPLAQPLQEEFRVGTLVIAWDDDVDRLIVEARSMIFDAGAGESALPEGAEIDEDDIPDDATYLTTIDGDQLTTISGDPLTTAA